MRRTLVIAGVVGVVAVLMIVWQKSSTSEYKKDAGRAVSVVKNAVAVVKSGTITYGEYDRLRSQVEQIRENMSSRPKSADPSEQASKATFEASLGLFDSQWHLLGTTKFLDEKLAKIGEGGISPAHSARVGVNEIRVMEDSLHSLEDEYKDLR